MTQATTVKLKSGAEVNTNAKTLEGFLRSVKFSKGTFVIIDLDGVICKGNINKINVNSKYKLEGRFVFDRKYNSWNFEFTKYQCSIDPHIGIIEYLDREAPGLGAKRAAVIANEFKKDTLKLIQEQSNLSRIPGLSETDRLKISAWAKSNAGVHDIKIKLYGIGLKPAVVRKLISVYGTEAEEKIKADCYSLSEIKGIGFKTVLMIAELLGIPKNDPGRIKATIIHCMNKFAEDGHVCIQYSELVREAAALAEVNQATLIPCLDKMIDDEDLLTDEKKFSEYVTENGINLN